jgi:hypothetical protein
MRAVSTYPDRGAARGGPFTSAIFDQHHAASAQSQWRKVAVPLRPKLPKLGGAMDQPKPMLTVY